MSWTAAVALALLCYTYFGYPALIAAMARLRPWRPRPDDGWEPTVSICVAAYNCESFIDAKLRSLVALEYPKEKLEFLVYSDGSTDATNEMVAAWGMTDPRVKLLSSEHRSGKPTALNRMSAAANGEVLVISDARQPLDRGALRALLCLLSAPGVSGVTGNLVLDGSAGSGMYWRYENWIRKQEARRGNLTGITGALSALRRSDFQPLAADLILDDAWICLHLRMSRGRVLLAEDAKVFDRAFDDEREFSRKVRTLAGNFQMFTRSPRLLLPLVNPSWLETVSHKVARLFCPWALFVLFFSSGLGSLGIGSHGSDKVALGAVFLAQIVFYALAAMGRLAGRFGILARTFVVMNAAAVIGLWRFVVGAQKITW